jgi:rfaE bifunctional protein kinase chain/domain/rfaE bifunctional protein nucleotidyltransferase chain/domain
MKIVNIEELSRKVKYLKDEGKKIVHCHGCFDLMHLGHIRHFQEAKKMGDVLVVTVTPDCFVKKGPNRPIFNETMRSEVIAAVDVVDFVAVNKWQTAIETIKLLEPDFYVKGPDYKDHSKDLTGNIQLEENAIKLVGGKIAFTANITFSSSSLINQQFSTLNEEQKKFLKKLKEKYAFKEIKEYVDRLGGLRVLLVGEVIIDEYVFCNSVGKSGKEPILVNQKISSEKYAGGVLAVANHISDFCKEVTIISFLGDRDDQKKFVKENLNTNVNIEYVHKSNSPTILKTRFVDNYTNNKILGVYDINDELISESDEDALIIKFEEKIKDFDIVIMLDYGHGLITPRMARLVEDKAKYVAVNTQLNSFNIGYHTISKYRKANYVCVHEGELRHDYRSRVDTVEHLTEKLSEQVKSDIIVVTRGNKGSLAFENNNFTSCPAYATTVVDRVGAGDTLLAITSLCFVTGVPADLTLFMGNLAASKKLAAMGTCVKLSKVDLLKSMNSLLK